MFYFLLHSYTRKSKSHSKVNITCFFPNLDLSFLHLVNTDSILPVAEVKNLKIIFSFSIFSPTLCLIHQQIFQGICSKYSQNPATYYHLCCLHPNSSHYHLLPEFLQYSSNWSPYLYVASYCLYSVQQTERSPECTSHVVSPPFSKTIQSLPIYSRIKLKFLQ